VGEGKALKDQLAAVEGDLNALEVELQREAGGVENRAPLRSIISPL